MKIYINKNNEIKAIHKTNLNDLDEIEVDRLKVFGAMSDFMILNYCFKLNDDGSVQLYAQSDYDKLVKEDYRLRFLESEKKIDILAVENKALNDSQDIQDRTIVENDMRMMDIEWALEDILSAIDLTLKINLSEVFTMKIFERSATYFNQLKQMIERENYDSKEEMERILNKYRSGRNPRIIEEEYDKLFDMLYPPVYDIPTEIPET